LEGRCGNKRDATTAKIDLAVAVASLAQKQWRKINSHKRAELLREAARKMRDTGSLVGKWFKE